MYFVKLIRTLLYFLIVLSVCGADDSNWSFRGAQERGMQVSGSREDSSQDSSNHAFTGVQNNGETWIIVVIVIACLIAVGIIVSIIVCVCCARSARRRPTVGYLAQSAGQMVVTAASAQQYVANTGLGMTTGGVNNGNSGDPNFSGHHGSFINKNGYESCSTQPYVANTGQEMTPGGVNNGYRGNLNHPRHHGSAPNYLNRY